MARNSDPYLTMYRQASSEEHSSPAVLSAFAIAMMGQEPVADVWAPAARPQLSLAASGSLSNCTRPIECNRTLRTLVHLERQFYFLSSYWFLLLSCIVPSWTLICSGLLSLHEAEHGQPKTLDRICDAVEGLKEMIEAGGSENLDGFRAQSRKSNVAISFYGFFQAAQKKVTCTVV
jgi:hypothetical protein